MQATTSLRGRIYRFLLHHRHHKELDRRIRVSTVHRQGGPRHQHAQGNLHHHLQLQHRRRFLLHNHSFRSCPRDLCLLSTMLRPRHPIRRPRQYLGRHRRDTPLPLDNHSILPSHSSLHGNFPPLSPSYQSRMHPANRMPKMVWMLTILRRTLFTGILVGSRYPPWWVERSFWTMEMRVPICGPAPCMRFHPIPQHSNIQAYPKSP